MLALGVVQIVVASHAASFGRGYRWMPGRRCGGAAAGRGRMPEQGADQLLRDLRVVRLAQYVPADEDRPCEAQKSRAPEEADPEGADDGLPGYGVAGEVEPGLELAREEVGL